MTDYVIYYRISTDKQGNSGLGLEVQRASAMHFFKDGRIVGEFEEVESGKRSSNRPQLLAAIEAAKKRKATPVIAKLDRLARNVHFISGLVESKVDFVAVDNPHANKTHIHLMAAFAEHEADQIFARTEAVRQAKKARRESLGNPRGRSRLGERERRTIPLRFRQQSSA